MRRDPFPAPKPKVITYTREILFCYECPHCVVTSETSRARDITFNCNKEGRPIHSFYFSSKAVADFFMFDLPRKFFEKNIYIPRFCKLQNAQEELKTKVDDPRQLSLFQEEAHGAPASEEEGSAGDTNLD